MAQTWSGKVVRGRCVAEQWEQEMCPAGCGGQIVWALDSQVKRIAVDALAADDGTLQLSVRWDGALRALVPSRKLAFGLRTLRHNHLKTCTKLGQFRRITGL
jgi:hypothetical protein